MGMVGVGWVILEVFPNLSDSVVLHLFVSSQNQSAWSWRLPGVRLTWLCFIPLQWAPPSRPSPRAELLGGDITSCPPSRHSDVTPRPPPPHTHALLPATSRSAPPFPPHHSPGAGGGGGGGRAGECRAGAGWKRRVRRGGAAVFRPSSLSSAPYGIFQDGLASFLSFLSL